MIFAVRSYETQDPAPHGSEVLVDEEVVKVAAEGENGSFCLANLEANFIRRFLNLEKYG